MNGLMGSLLGSLAPGLAARPAATQQKFQSHFTIPDGDAAYDTAAEVFALLGAAAAGYRLIWQKTCPAQQQLRWGFGSGSQPHNQGYMWFCILDTNVDFCFGTVRLVIANARQTKVFTVKEIDDTRLHTTTITTLTTATPTDINTMIALPEQLQFPKVGEDSLMQIWYAATDRATAEDNAGFSVPITVYQ